MNIALSDLEEGIYYNIPNDQYHNQRSLSSTGVKKLINDTPFDYWQYSVFNLKREPIDSHAMKLGRAYHTLLLEPEKFSQEFTIKPKVKSSTVAMTLGEGEYLKMQEGVEAVRHHPTAGPLFCGGNPEVSIVWKDQETGVLCRVRFDYLHKNWTADLKTTTDISTNALYWEIRKRGYHISAAMYLEGLNVARKNGWIEDSGHHYFVLAFLRKPTPANPGLPIVRTIQIDEEFLTKGYEEFRRGLHIYKEHMEQYGPLQPWGTGFNKVETMYYTI